jgi:hypothetical protein
MYLAISWYRALIQRAYAYFQKRKRKREQGAVDEITII